MKKAKSIAITLVALAMFFSPMVIYMYVFGFGVWSEHQKWAEMGSAFSGFYSPMMAILAFVILIGQFNLQKGINKHQYDMTFIQDNRAELNYYIDKLVQLLDMVPLPELSARSQLNLIAELSEKELRSQAGIAVCEEFAKRNGAIFDIWLAVQPILMGLGANDEYPYQHNYKSSCLRLTAMLSLRSCIGLDKLYFSVNQKITRRALRFWSEDDT